MPTAVLVDGKLEWGFRKASPKEVARKVYGAWAKIACEPTPRGLKAFSEMVPRDQETHSRWTQSPHHREWQDAAHLHDRLVILAPIEHGKTEQLTVARTAWEIGCDPNLRHLLVQNTANQAIKTSRAIRSLVEESADYRRVFPAVRPWHPKHAAALWTDQAWTVQRKNVHDRNPTFQATGLYGSVLGMRCDRQKLDDVEDLENTRSPEARRKTMEWVRTTCFSRLTRRARVIVAETSWHPEDFPHSLRKQGWPTIVHECRRADGSYLWDRYDAAWETAKVRELGPTAAARMLYNRVRADELSRIQEAWIHKAMLKGVGQKFHRRATPPNGYGIVVGVDLAVGRGEDHDLTAFSTLLVDPKGDIQLLSLESGRWSGPDIVGRIIDHSRRYPGAVILVENNGAQDYIRQFAAEHVATVLPYTTGNAKADPRYGIEALATELFNGRWTIPCRSCSPGLPLVFDAEPEIHALIDEMFDYSPSAHTGDRLMATWLAREGVRKGTQVVGNFQM